MKADFKATIAKANRNLQSMSKRAKTDMNVKNALDRAQHSLEVFYKNPTSKISTKGLTNKQKEQIYKISKAISGSQYATENKTNQLYKKQAQTFADTYNISYKKARQFQDLLKNDKDFQNVWERVKGDYKYIADRKNPNQNDGIENILKQKNGVKKFGQMVEIYDKTQGDYKSFMDFLNDDTIKELSKWDLKDIEKVKDSL